MPSEVPVFCSLKVSSVTFETWARKFEIKIRRPMVAAFSAVLQAMNN